MAKPGRHIYNEGFKSGLTRCRGCDAEMFFHRMESFADYQRRAGNGSRSKRKSLATVDHLIPASEGGSNACINIVLLCAECNSHKAAMTVLEWAAKMTRLGRPLPQENVEWLSRKEHRAIRKQLGRIMCAPPEPIEATP